MKNFENATPRPWKINKGEAWTKQIAIIDPVKKHYLCTIAKRFDNSEANAELIVTAVNSYDAMKEALQQMVDNYETPKDGTAANHAYANAVKLLSSLK